MVSFEKGPQRVRSLVLLFELSIQTQSAGPVALPGQRLDLDYKVIPGQEVVSNKNPPGALGSG